ncbi:MAG: enoyl-CoA hydratase [Betaproteobacteria bacterium]|nr:enoyl-CoA hydratase [Betaproteobacteria bacterium]
MNEVLLSTPEAGIALIRINREEARNALNDAVRARLADFFGQLSEDKEVRCIILTGGSRVFAAGADIKAMAEASAIDIMLRATHRLWQAITACGKPIIAAVNGLALGGGCELAMNADLIIAGESARFGQPEIKLGIIPGAGGTQRLTRAVGKFKAMKMLLTGQPIGAAEAFGMGLVSEVVGDDQVLERAMALAREIAALPPLAIAQVKEVVLAGQDIPLEAALMLERKAFQILFASADQKEGMRAFIEKRPPEFKGI